MLQPIPITIPPGVVSTPTKKSKSSNWRDAHLIRWVGGKMQPVGGWAKIPYTTFASKIRAIHRWTTNGGISMVAYLCEGHLYVDQGDGLLTDISPTTPIVEPNGSLVQGGYGDFTYSYGTYGTPRPDRQDLSKRITPGYYLDNWGQNLVIMTGSDGRLLMWDPSTPTTHAAAVTNAPLGNRAFVVTPQRFVILFGAGGIMNRYAWCDQEDITDWDFANVASKAGFNEVQPASPIIACCRSNNDVVFFTESGHAYYIEFIGSPYIFGGDKFGEGVTPYSPMSIVDTPDGAVWVSSSGVWTYQSRSVSTVPCPLWSDVETVADKESSRYTASAMISPSYAELWWFYSSGDTVLTNDRYMVFNYKEQWWSKGYTSRSCGTNGTYTGYPLMSDGNSVYQHEYGNYYEESDLPWAASYPISMDYGASLATLARMLVDFDGNTSSISAEIDYNIPRSGVALDQTSGEKKIENDGHFYFYVTGRDFRVTFRQTENGAPLWTLGDNSIYATPRGSK